MDHRAMASSHRPKAVPGRVRRAGALLATLGLMAGVGCQQLGSAGSSAELASADARVVSWEEVDGVSIPLPEGQWQLAASVSEVGNFPNFPQEHTALVSVTDHVVDRMVTVWVQRRLRAQDWFSPFDYCTDPSYPYSKVDVNQRNLHRCWHVRAVNLATAGAPSSIIRELDQYARQHALFLPVVMIGVRFIEGRGRERHYVEYLWNADALFPKAGEDLWLPIDWTRQAVDSDPRRKAVMHALAEWGERWRPLVGADPQSISTAVPRLPAPAGDQGGSETSIDGRGTVIDTATLRIDARVVRLDGVRPSTQAAMARELQLYIEQNGGSVRCEAVRDDAWRCETVTGYDVGAAVILNGAGQAAPGAPREYFHHEATAKAQRVGMWR